MSTFPEQFSQARQAQIEAQLAAFRNFSSKAVENTEKLVALNLSTSRAALEKSSAAVQQILSAKDPRDLLALTTQTQDHFDSLLAYGRALFGIAADIVPAAAAVARTAPALAAPAPVAAKVVKPAPIAEAPAVVLAPEVVAEAAPEVAAKPRAKPAAKAEPEAATIPVLEEVVASDIAPVEAAPEPAPAAAKPVVTAKSSKKKQ